MLPNDKEVHIAEIHCLIVPMIIGDVQRNYSDFIAYLLWRIPQTMVDVVREYNEGERMPDDGSVDPEPIPDPLPIDDLEFTEAKVNAWALTVRAGPNVQYRIIRYLIKGQRVKVYDTKTGWSTINFEGTEWVSSTYLTPL